MWKPFLVSLGVGLALVWLFRAYKKNQALDSVTYKDPRTGETIFAGPDIDPLTGESLPATAGNRTGSVGSQVIN